MKLALAVAASLAQVWLSKALMPEDTTPSVRIHPRSLIKRGGRDCGRFVMFCEKAAAACKNACYHLNCVDKTTATMVYDAGHTNAQNRLQSGCQTADGSVCNSMPFSQKLHDPLNSAPGDVSVNCDEWPMATIKQNDFVEGTIRNSLRCIPMGENSSGGAQVNAFISGTNRQGPNKTCDGDIQDGDYWTVDFDYTNTNDVDVQHCKQPDQCDNDRFAFHMTKKNGHLSFPYNFDNDNHYALGLATPDLLQCRVVVNLHGEEAETTVYDETGEQKGSTSGQLKNPNDITVVSGLPLDLTVINGNGDITNPVSFKYGTSADIKVNINVLEFFSWQSGQTGSSKQFNDDGRYCNIQVDGDQSTIDCYFPCVAGTSPASAPVSTTIPTPTPSPTPTPTQAPSYAPGTCAFHLTETQSCLGDDSNNLFAIVHLVDAAKAVIGDTPVDINPLGAPINAADPYSFTSKLPNPIVIVGEHENDYIQFTYGALMWKSTDNTGPARCNVGGWDPRDGPSCWWVIQNAVNNMDCFFPC